MLELSIVSKGFFFKGVSHNCIIYKRSSGRCAGKFMCFGKCKRKLLILHIFLILTFEVPIDYLCKNLWCWFCYYCNSNSLGMAIVNGLKVLTTTSLCSFAWILLTGIYACHGIHCLFMLICERLGPSLSLVSQGH